MTEKLRPFYSNSGIKSKAEWEAIFGKPEDAKDEDDKKKPRVKRQPTWHQTTRW